MENFENSVVLITGGGTGIGKATASAFIAQGAKVVITGRRQSVIDQTVQELGSQAYGIAGDISKHGEPARVIEEVISKFGRLDVLVNNAGTGSMGPLSETSDEVIENIYRTNVFAPLALIREATGYLAESKGVVINISSVTSSGMMPGVVAYASSKAAVDHTTKLLAVELGPVGSGLMQSHQALQIPISQPMLNQMKKCWEWLSLRPHSVALVNQKTSQTPFYYFLITVLDG